MQSAPVVLQAVGAVTQLPHSATGSGEACNCDVSIDLLLTGLLITEMHACLF